MSDHDQRETAITQLFDGFLAAKPRAERIARYVKLTLPIPAERLERACRQLELSASKLPTVADIWGAAQNLQDQEEGQDEEERRLLRYALGRYSDTDYWCFYDRFGLKPSRSLFARHRIQPHADVTFREPTREECDAERSGIVEYERQAKETLRRKKRTGMAPVSEIM